MGRNRHYLRGELACAAFCNRIPGLASTKPEGAPLMLAVNLPGQVQS